MLRWRRWRRERVRREHVMAGQSRVMTEHGTSTCTCAHVHACPYLARLMCWLGCPVSGTSQQNGYGVAGQCIRHTPTSVSVMALVPSVAIRESWTSIADAARWGGAELELWDIMAKELGDAELAN